MCEAGAETRFTYSASITMAQIITHKDLPQPPPKSHAIAPRIASGKPTIKDDSKIENSGFEYVSPEWRQGADFEHRVQEDEKKVRLGLRPAMRTHTVDRIISKIEDATELDLRKDVDQALPILERMDIWSRTEMVVRIYNRLDKAQRDRLKEMPGSVQLSREGAVWERRARQRLRML